MWNPEELPKKIKISFKVFLAKIYISRNETEFFIEHLKKESWDVDDINELIDCAIQNTQKGGNMELQVILMNYKNEHFGFDDDDDIENKFKI